MAWWSRTQGLATEPKKSVPKGIWTKCERCSTTLYEADLDANLRVCASCQHHFRMSTEGRIQMIVDDGSWQEHDRTLESSDPLGFRVDGKKYVDQLKSANRKVGAGDAYRAGTSTVGGIAVEAGFFAFEFMGGSMGSVVGEKIARQFERAVAHRRPAIMFCASGGARMQEGVLSLMQMAKTSAARGGGGGAPGRRPGGRAAGGARPRCRTSRCCCTRPPAAWRPRSRCSATSSSPSPTR
jgi:acetyl-CoA carboxylase carboxyl transferase subunit beta